MSARIFDVRVQCYKMHPPVGLCLLMFLFTRVPICTNETATRHNMLCAFDSNVPTEYALEERS